MLAHTAGLSPDLWDPYLYWQGFCAVLHLATGLPFPEEGMGEAWDCVRRLRPGTLASRILLFGPPQQSIAMSCWPGVFIAHDPAGTT